VSLFDLVGMDDRGRIYVRSGSSVTRLFPFWRLTACGAVYDRESGNLAVAYGVDDPGRLVVAEYGPDSTCIEAWPLFVPEFGGRQVSLVDVVPGPGFVFHMNGSTRVAGTLVTVDRKGEIQASSAPDDDVAQDLVDCESRIDLTQAAVAPDGSVLVPLSDPNGYRVMRFHPPVTL
jgi:hypothetical protein